jgi:hypothetical protein
MPLRYQARPAIPGPAPLQVVEGTSQGITGPPGFPSLRTLKVGGEVRRAGVNVFGMASRKDSLILQLKVTSWRAASPPYTALVGLLVAQGGHSHFGMAPKVGGALLLTGRLVK